MDTSNLSERETRIIVRIIEKILSERAGKRSNMREYAEWCAGQGAGMVACAKFVTHDKA